MTANQMRFDDGAAYERMMGVWSALAGNTFLDWLAPRSSLRWIDIGCGSGAFTELLFKRCRPTEIVGIDPSDGQLDFARKRGVSIASFQQGGAVNLPVPPASFDAAVMALVIFFVPDPAKGVAEMARVLRPGGIAAAYAWDMLGGGFPLEPIHAEIRALGLKPVYPPSPEASQIDNMRSLWTTAGFQNVETTEITTTRTFASFDEFWATNLLAASLKATMATMPIEVVEQLKDRVRGRLRVEKSGQVICFARANAVKGSKPV
jgi:ubiquinone/menaquinone biosynthesis C-methylase UbiE